jgi:pimeloyl-ACP methyl ester carboxylesterase
VKRFFLNTMRARRRALQQRAHFDTWDVFSSSEFPEIKWEIPRAIAALLTSAQSKTSYFDAAGERVTEANAPGRYGAMLEIISDGAVLYRKFVTLFRASSDVDHRLPVDSNALPNALGISADIQRVHAEAIHEFKATTKHVGYKYTPSSAELLASLFEAKAADGAFKGRTRPSASCAEWWFGVQKQHGLLKHRYHIDLPADYGQDATTRWPLVLFLHGSGERGLDLEAVRDQGPPRLVRAGCAFPFILVSPQCDPGAWWQPVAVVDLLNEIRKKYNVDDARVYLTGLSMGGFGTWFTAMHFPERFAAIAPICGGGDPRDADLVKDVPLWAFHGMEDRVVKPESTTHMVDALNAIGGDPKMTLYDGVGHNSWDKAYAGDTLYTWLLGHTLKQLG